MADPLPDLLMLSDFGNVWDTYLEELYRVYMAEIVNGNLTLNDLPIKFQFRPMSHGKGFGFWHLISKGESEEERTRDLRRCERLRWIGWIIKNVKTNADILWWENQRGSSTHVVLWLKSAKFAVILAKRKDYYLLKSAYPVYSDREKSFEREWKQYWEKG
jgi:hypothetical protein